MCVDFFFLRRLNKSTFYGHTIFRDDQVEVILLFYISKMQLVVYYQCCGLIG